MFEKIVDWFKSTADWVQENLGDPALAREIREDLGLAAGAEIPPAAKGKFSQHAAGLDPDKESFQATADEIAGVVADLIDLANDLRSPQQTAADAFYLLMKIAAVDSVRVRAPGVYAIGRFTLFIGDDIESFAELDPGRIATMLYGDNLPPGEAVVQRIATGGALLVEALDRLLFDRLLGPGSVQPYYGWDPSPGSPTPVADLVSARALTLDIGPRSGSGGRVVLTFLGVPAEHGGPGLVVSLGGALEVEQTVDGTRYEFQAAVPGSLHAFIPFAESPRPFAIEGDPSGFLRVDVTRGTSTGPAFRIGEAGKTRLDVHRLLWGVELNPTRAGFRLSLRDAELVVDLGDADGFLQSIAGGEMRLHLDFGLLVDTEGGFRLEGGTKTRVSLPVAGSLAGVLTVHHVELELGEGRDGADLGLALSGGFGARIGPFGVVIDRLGFRLDADFGQGNLGVVDLDIGFQPPSGVGLRLDAGVIKGGGYLSIDPLRGEYSGSLELQFGPVGVKAIGLLSTRMPDGTPGWSLLLFVFGQFPPIQLSFGFTLNALGGMIGLQHGVSIEELIAGMKTGAFDDILFPSDPVADAPRILNRLRRVFPVATRALTIGPMVDLGWGTPRILFIRLGIVIQLDNALGSGPAPVSLSRFTLIGQLRVQVVPDALSDVTPVRLIVDILGFWDLDEKRWGFLSRLRDSRVGPVDVTGTLAMYGEYGERPRFLLAAGGFHPRFQDVPEGIRGAVDRIGSNFKLGRFKIVLAGYFAVAPATVQAGASLTCRGDFGPVGLSGEIGFDVICYFEPRFHFRFDFRAHVKVEFKGRTLAGVAFKGTLEGPGRWNVEGKVSFSILLWDVEVSIDESWGKRPPPELAETNVQQALQRELGRRENWSAQLPAGGEGIVTLAPPEGTEVALGHPLGRFVFSQRTVPFGLELERFGNGGIVGPKHFEIVAVTVGGRPVEQPTPVREHFARAQFLDLSKEEKLTQPSFEPMDAGVEFAGLGYSVPESGTWTPLEYETAYLDIRPGRFAVSIRTVLTAKGLPGSLALAQAQGGAAGRSSLRAEERMAARRDARLSVVPPPLAVARSDTLARSEIVSLVGQARHADALARQVLAASQRSDLLVVEEYELAGGPPS